MSLQQLPINIRPLQHHPMADEAWIEGALQDIFHARQARRTPQRRCVHRQQRQAPMSELDVHGQRGHESCGLTRRLRQHLNTDCMRNPYLIGHELDDGQKELVIPGVINVVGAEIDQESHIRSGQFGVLQY